MKNLFLFKSKIKSLFSRSNRILSNESGFTLLEAITSLIFVVLLFSLVLSVYDIGVSKSSYIDNDSTIINFENEISSWLEKDYRENNLSEIKLGGQPNHLIFVLSDGNTIEYLERPQGYYRISNGKSILLSKNKVESIVFKPNNTLWVNYYLKSNTVKKVLKIKLYK